jgi:Tfp pilus assembly protein PilV
MSLWKRLALIAVLVAVVVIVLLLLGDTLGVNHQGHSLRRTSPASNVGRATN